ncbi:MAG: VWA domain-containing protein [Calditrichaeota bacterium]|nr:VWA domain-containing protein [Calditrichota bacterium]
MRGQNFIPTFICLLCISIVFLFTGCEKPKIEIKPVKQIAQIEEEEIPLIPLDDSDGIPSLTRNFYFIFDGSGSMGDMPGGSSGVFDDKLEGAKWAVKEFMKKVPNDVNLGLYVFDKQGTREVVALGSGSRNNFLRAVEEVNFGGGTPLYDAITSGTDQLVKQYKQQLGYGEYRLIVVTDGEAEHIPAAANYASKFGIPIYTIGLFIGADHPLREYSISYRAADSFDDLAKALEETVAELPSFDATEFQELQ